MLHPVAGSGGFIKGGIQCTILQSTKSIPRRFQTGVRHIENEETGEMLEFSVFPAQYRGAMQVPVEVYPCNQYPWHANEDLRFYTYRFEVEWKDRVYCDVSYWIQNEQTVLVRARCVNNTEMSQNLCLHYLANSYRPPFVSV